MTSPQVVVLADDLTGAADSGVMFANHGLTTMAFWWGGARLPEDGALNALPPADARVISSESRECERAEALCRVRQCVRSYIQPAADVWLYKKIDSTLRGHPGAELAVLMEESGRSRALIAPAFPEQGRTTIGGVHRVHGVWLDKTVFGRDGVSGEVASTFAEAFGHDAVASLPLDVIRQGRDAASDVMRATRARVIVADAETREDLLTLVRSAQQCEIRLLCGSAGLAGALGDLVTWEMWVSPPDLPARQGDLILVVAGSRHPSTRDQMLSLMGRGVLIVAPSAAWLTDPTASTHKVTHELSMKDRRSEPSAAVLTTVGLPSLPGQGAFLVRKLAKVVRDLAERGRLAGLVLTGGDTAIAVADALEAEALWLHGEVRPGVPWGAWIGGVGAGLPVVTKAGGFGEEDILLAAIEHLRALPWR